MFVQMRCCKIKRTVEWKRATQNRKNEYVCSKTKHSGVEKNNNSGETEDTEDKTVNYRNSQKKCLRNEMLQKQKEQ